MSKRALTIIALLSTIAAIATVFYTQNSISRLMTVQNYPVLLAPVPPYTIIRAEMVGEKELPKSLAQQNIYVDAVNLIGKMSKVTIPADVVIYRQFAVIPSEFRYVDDESLSIISFPVEPEKAVGGQIQIGQKIDIWRVKLADTTHADNSGGSDAESERLAGGVRVVDIRSTKGERAGVVGGQSRSQVESVSTTQKEQVVPLTIVTVAVDEDTAQAITQLMGDIAGRYDFWLSLSALNTDESTEMASRKAIGYVTATPLPTVTPVPPTATVPQVLVPQATATPVPTLENPTATATAIPVPTLENPTATPVPPTVTPILPTPTATPAWDYSLTVQGIENMEDSEGPSYVQGVLLDKNSNSLAGQAVLLTWDGGKLDATTGGGGTFSFIVGAGEYFFKLPDKDVEAIRLTIADDKHAHRITLEVRQVR